MSPEDFNRILKERFGTPNPGSNKEERMEHAAEVGKIQRGEIGLSGVGRALETDLGVPVQISVVRVGGAFDQGPYVPLK